MINAGEFDQRLILQQPDAGQDAAGQPLTTFSDVAEVWAKVRPTRGRDFVAGDGKQSTIDAQVCIRYRSDVTAAWRVKWRLPSGDVPYDIVGEPANVRGAREELELNCTAGVRDGRE